jgi:hypothetical protein
VLGTFYDFYKMMLKYFQNNNISNNQIIIVENQVINTDDGEKLIEVCQNKSWAYFFKLIICISIF